MAGDARRGTTPTEVVCGAYIFESTLAHNLLGALPDLVVLNVSSDRTLATLVGLLGAKPWQESPATQRVGRRSQECWAVFPMTPATRRTDIMVP